MSDAWASALYLDDEELPRDRFGLVHVDCYGDRLRAYSLDRVISSLARDNLGYRRVRWALALLRTIAISIEPGEEVYVVPFGH